MFNFIAGVRSSPPAPSSRHLAITSQHLLSQAHAHKAMGNLEAAQKSYRDAIEKAKIEHEKNPGNLQEKKTFDAISKEFFSFLKELPSNGHQEQSTVANLGEQSHISMSPQPVVLPAQAKSELVDYLFEKALLTLGSLEVPDKPSLFLVYAHDNPAYGRAEANISRYLIDQLSKIRINLYSDQTPMGQACLSSSEDLKKGGTLEDILTSQLCLLPTQLRGDVKPVSKVIVCCSEVLGNYLKWPHYPDFYQELQKAYRKDLEQNGCSAIREVVRKFSQEPEYKKGFHHVLTEMAFLQIRAEQPKEHGIIPVSLTRQSYDYCLKDLIPSTTVRIENISRFEEQTEAGQGMHPNQSRHETLFKLIERVLVGSDKVKAFLDPFWKGCRELISRLENEPSTLGVLEFQRLVDKIFGDIQKTLQAQLSDQIQNLSQHTEALQKLLPPNFSSRDLRNALHRHYDKHVNLSIQRVSGGHVSLDDCYINLAIVESYAQREQDQAELKKQAAAFERLPSGERLDAANPNKLIELDKLFEPQTLRDGQTGVPKRILIQGRAGIGKTTLCKKLVHEYHHNGLWQDRFESVLWVPLRQLKVHSPKRLEDLLCTQYFSGHESSQAQALSKVFYAHQNKTLFILDGLDEVFAELDEQSPLRELIQNLLSQMHVLITSRPAGVDLSLLDQLDLELETVGFTPDNIRAYIEKSVEEPKNQVAIQQFIDCTPLIQGLVNIPIQLDALCYSWDDSFAKDQESVTMATLYEAMVNKLWRKDGANLEKGPKGKPFGPLALRSMPKARLEKIMASEIYYLGYLAFKGLETGKIEFSLDDLDECQQDLEDQTSLGLALPDEFIIDLKKTSYLHTADAERPEVERHYHFLHLTFQEFFAAKFLVKHFEAYSKNMGVSALGKAARANEALILSEDALYEFIAGCKYNPRYEIVWWMVGGLLKGSALEHFFTLLEEAPRDLIGGRHQQMIMGCLNEARTQLSKTTAGRLERELMQGLHFEFNFSEYGWSELGRQRTFPEDLLLEDLKRPEGHKENIVRTLGARSILSEGAIFALIEALLNENKGVKNAAARALAKQSTLPTAAISRLENALEDDTAEVRFAASRALGVQNTQPEANISMLINALQDEDKELRVETAKALGEQKTLPETAILALTDALQDSNDEVKIEAAQALSGQSTPLPEATISILIHGLQDKSKKIRYWTANVLSNRKETLSEAHISALINVLQDEDESIKVLAAMALVNQETLPEAAIPILSNLLQDDNKDFRSLVANALQKHSRLPEAIISALSKALQDDHQTSRLAAVIALGGQSTLSEVAISALCNALQDKSVKSMVRSMVVPILGRQSVLSEAAILALSNAALKDDNKKIRLQATVTLKNQSMLPESVIIALGDALNDSYNYVRMWAAMVLGDQNTLPEKAIFALIGALQDKDEGVSYIAADILRAQKTLPEVATRSLSEILSAGDNEYIKSAAAIGLLSPNSLSETAISALTGALFDKNKGIRFIAAIGLSMQITLSEVTLSALSNALQDEYEQVRFVAAMALSNQSVLPEATIFALISALQDDCEYVGFAAAKALRVQKALSDVAISALNDKLQDHSKEISSAAASTIDEQNILPEAAVSALSKSLQDENKEVRCGAAAVLGIQKVLPEAVISALINVLQDEDEGVRSIAANALVGQKMLSEAAISTLSNALQDNCEAVKLDTVRALAGQNTLPETAIAALSRALQDDIEEEVRFAVAEVLIGQKELPEVAISALNNALQDGYEEVRVAAVIALSRQKVLSETAISALSEVLQGTEENMKAAAITALSEQKVLPECAISALIYTLQDDNTHMRFIAAKALSQQKSLSEQAISALTQALWSSNASVRHVIVVALRGQKTLSENVISALIHSLQDEDSEVRYAAIDVLREQNTLSEDAILVLIHALKDNDEAVRFAAARVLSRENTQPEATTLALSKALLKDDSGRVRGAAARALRGQKALPKVALSALIHALQDDTKEVRSAAVWALGWNIEQIYSLLPSLELDELQTLYAKFLFAYSCGHIALLHTQGNRLHFFTEKGPGQTKLVDAEAIDKLIEALKAPQMKGETSLVLEERLFLKEE